MGTCRYVMYNLERGGYSADKLREVIVGMKGMQFQVFMTDVLYWLGIMKNRMVSMGNV